jgi:hypothetical protein
MIIDQHVQCRQEGVEPCSHKRPSMPFSHFMVNPTRRTGPGWHADSFKTPGTSAPSSRIKLDYSSLSKVMGSERIRRPVAW